MKYKAFSVRDHKLGIYHPPMFNEHTAAMLRQWDVIVNNKESMIYRYPDDYGLFIIGEFDGDSGLLTRAEAPQQISTASEVRKEQ